MGFVKVGGVLLVTLVVCFFSVMTTMQSFYILSFEHQQSNELWSSATQSRRSRLVGFIIATHWSSHFLGLMVSRKTTSIGALVFLLEFKNNFLSVSRSRGRKFNSKIQVNDAASI